MGSASTLQTIAAAIAAGLLSAVVALIVARISAKPAIMSAGAAQQQALNDSFDKLNTKLIASAEAEALKWAAERRGLVAEIRRLDVCIFELKAEIAALRRQVIKLGGDPEDGPPKTKGTE